MSAACGASPWRMNSTARNAPHTMMFDSPRPVEPAAPTTLSVYSPAPMIGESPTRPGTFHDRPLVVVHELTSPAAFTAFMLMVPWVQGAGPAPADARPSCSTLLPLLAFHLSQLVRAFSLIHGSGLRVAFHLSQSCFDFSVRRFCSLNPI